MSKDKDVDREVLQACEIQLRALQPVRKVEFKPQTARLERRGLDGEIVLHTDMGRLTYSYEVKKRLSLPRLEHLLLHLRQYAREAKAQLLLFADYVPPRLAERLIAEEVNFVDGAGNVYLQGGKPKYLREARTGRLTQPSGLQVVFVLLADPQAVSTPYRKLAEVGGVALGSVGWIVRELKARGYLEQKGRDEWTLIRRRELLDLWVGGYGDRLRRKLLMGRFQPPERDLNQTVGKFESNAEAVGITWALTGGFAADVLTRYFRGDQLGVFVSEWPAELMRKLKWLPSVRGPVAIFRKFSPLVIFEGKQPFETPVAHPLLVYAELVYQGRERELEAAKSIYDRHLAFIINGD
jgi:hypothetical protein